jgi:hypothetical protein
MWFHIQVVLDIGFYGFRVAIQLRKAVCVTHILFGLDFFSQLLE